jgi:hypothetical protein
MVLRDGGATVHVARTIATPATDAEVVGIDIGPW